MLHMACQENDDYIDKTKFELSLIEIVNTISNISKSEREAILSLKNNNNIVIK